MVGKHDESFPRNSLANYNVVTCFERGREKGKKLVGRKENKRDGRGWEGTLEKLLMAALS